MERSYGPFHRTFEFPTSVETDRVKADFKKGILLTVTIPKKASEKSRQIPISS